MAIISTAQLIAGSMPANRTKAASIAALQFARGVQLLFHFGVSLDEENLAMKRNEGTVTKERLFNFRPSSGKPIILHLVQTQSEDGAIHMNVCIEDAATGEVLGSNDNGDLPPIIHTKPHVLDHVNAWAGREVAVLVPTTIGEMSPEQQAQALKESMQRAKEELNRRTKSRPTNIEYDLMIATMLVNKAQAKQLTQKKFDKIGKDSRRYGGEWSRGETQKKEPQGNIMSEENKKALDSWSRMSYTHSCQ